jgi:hypothetical protein
LWYAQFGLALGALADPAGGIIADLDRGSAVRAIKLNRHAAPLSVEDRAELESNGEASRRSRFGADLRFTEDAVHFAYRLHHSIESGSCVGSFHGIDQGARYAEHHSR